MGDIGEDVAPLSDTLSRIQTSDNPNENIFAYAYIMPVQDGGGNTSFINHDVYFSRNNSATGDSNGLGITAQIGQGQDSGSSESNDFWVSYVQIAYQGDSIKDADPNFALTDDDKDVAGQTPAVTNDSVSNSSQVPLGGQGSLVYIETLSDYFRNRGFSERGLVTAHEIGHQFGINGDGINQGVMTGSATSIQIGDEKFIPLHINVMRWRVKSPGK